MKPIFVTVILVCSALIANAQLRYVAGNGNSFVMPGAEITIQLVEDAAKNIYENLDATASDSQDALGTLEKKTPAMTCVFHSKNKTGPGFFNYSCEIHLDIYGKILN